MHALPPSGGNTHAGLKAVKQTIRDKVLPPGFGDLVLRRQKGVVDSGRGRVSERRQSQQLDLREAQRAGVTGPVEPQAHGRRHLGLHQLDLDVCQAAGDDWRGERQHVDSVSADLHRD